MIIDFNNINLEKLLPKNILDKNTVDFLKSWNSSKTTVSVKTSGSTGHPKIIEVEKEKMKNSAGLTCNFLGLKTGDYALLCLPTDYISGKMMVVRAIGKKMKLYVENTSLKPLENFSETVDFCAMTPLQVENSLDKIHLVKKLIIGGAKVSETLKTKIIDVLANTENQVFETYGMSETLSHIALRQITPKKEDQFKVFDGIEISVDERNCLRIFAPMLDSEILQTNDIVELKSENSFKFIGRADFIINSGGLKISPELLENLVKKEIANEIAFLGVPDEKLGEKLILVIEGKQDETIVEKIKNLEFPSKNHYPKEIRFLAEFPRSENGKVLRLEILNLMNED